ncbi:MAG: hypothetical protein K0S33_88 [Bacteroidetes bacterium]|jgi:hypothetical protein|nr:hypothetical protein [Bacteroidota bacterium]
MSQQNYSNHKRYYTSHHFVFYPVLGALLLFSLYCCFTYSKNRMIWAVITALCAAVIWLSFMLRQHYALGNQNRIVILEMRLRYFTLTGKRMEEIEDRLSFGQIAALRFAPDEEFLPLLERTLKEKLEADAIKRAIKNWKPDYRRV